MNVNLLFTEIHHPIVVTPNKDASIDAFKEYLATNQVMLQQLLHKHGGILFRGFSINGAQNFHTCLASLGAKPFQYVGGNSPRRRVIADVFTSTEYPATEVISLHNEMSYLPSWPTRLFFYSEVPASTGGQTSLASGKDVLKAMPENVVSVFRQKRINYVRNFNSNVSFGKSWQSTYQTEDREVVEKIAAEQSSICEWPSDGIMRISTGSDALTIHPVTGEEVWFNQAEQWHPSSLKPVLRGMIENVVGKGNMPHECNYADGGAINEELLDEVRRVLNLNKLLFDWQRNDLLMIDNVLMMHGRESFKGERKTLAYLSST